MEVSCMNVRGSSLALSTRLHKNLSHTVCTLYSGVYGGPLPHHPLNQRKKKSRQTPLPNPPRDQQPSRQPTKHMGLSWPITAVGLCGDRSSFLFSLFYKKPLRKYVTLAEKLA